MQRLWGWIWLYTLKEVFVVMVEPKGHEAKMLWAGHELGVSFKD